MIKLSVVIAVYNVERYIEQCACSLINQEAIRSDAEYELIFINDGSTDNSLQILNSTISGCSNCSVYSKPNGGLSSARNLGMQKAQGEYIAFVDSDDWVSRDYIPKILSAIECEHPDLIYFDRFFCSGENKKKIVYADFSGVLLEPGVVINSLNMSACNKVYKAKLCRRIGFEQGVVYEDFSFVIEYLCSVKRIYKINDGLYFVRQDNAHSITSKIQKNEMDMLYNFDRLYKTISSLEQVPATLFFKELSIFRARTIIGWSAKLVRCGGFDILRLVDYSEIGFFQANDIKCFFMLFFLKLRCFRVLRVLLTARHLFLKTIKNK